ncbi:MAG: diacylglycerol kinase family protein [Synechococcaceae cyanobacterium RL_1_2]|nr:diacylglycerol kinase family protein [Synechococcaceae cyanobacterium RL_1_2]
MSEPLNRKSGSVSVPSIEFTHNYRPELERPLAWRIAPDLFSSFLYAWSGITYSFTTQRNFKIHTFIGSTAIVLGVLLKITAIEMGIVALTISLVLVLELVNTALESVVDLTVKQSYHDLAKIAKDCAAGAVLISAMTALFVAGLIFLPPIVAIIISP